MNNSHVLAQAQVGCEEMDVKELAQRIRASAKRPVLSEADENFADHICDCDGTDAPEERRLDVGEAGSLLGYTPDLDLVD